MTDHHDKVPDAPEHQTAGKTSGAPAGDTPSGALDAPTLGDGPQRRAPHPTISRAHLVAPISQSSEAWAAAEARRATLTPGVSAR